MLPKKLIYNYIVFTMIYLPLHPQILMKKLNILLSVFGSLLLLFIILEAYVPETHRPTVYVNIATKIFNNIYQYCGYKGVQLLDICYHIYYDYLYYLWHIFTDFLSRALAYLPKIFRTVLDQVVVLWNAFERIYKSCTEFVFAYQYIFVGIKDALISYDNLKNIVSWILYVVPIPVILAQVFLPTKLKPSTLIELVTPYLKSFFWFVGYYTMRSCMWIYNIFIYAMIYQPSKWILVKIYNVIKLNLLIKLIVRIFDYFKDKLNNAVIESTKLLVAICNTFLSVFSIFNGIRDAPLVDKYCTWVADWIWNPVYNWVACKLNFSSNNESTRVNKGDPVRHRSPIRRRQ